MKWLWIKKKEGDHQWILRLRPDEDLYEILASNNPIWCKYPDGVYYDKPVDLLEQCIRSGELVVLSENYSDMNLVLRDLG